MVVAQVWQRAYVPVFDRVTQWARKRFYNWGNASGRLGIMTNLPQNGSMLAIYYNAGKEPCGPEWFHPPLPLSAWENDTLSWSEWVIHYKYDSKQSKAFDYKNTHLIFNWEMDLSHNYRPFSLRFPSLCCSWNKAWPCRIDIDRPGCSGHKLCWTLSSRETTACCYLETPN